MKEKLSACVTMADSHTVFSNAETDIIKKFISAVESVKEFIDLTMRDEFLLNQAKSIITNRRYGY